MASKRITIGFPQPSTTVLSAGVIVALTAVPGLLDFFLRFPELLLVQAGCILLINKYLNFRLFEGANPLTARPAASQPERAAVHVEQLGPSRRA